MYSHRCITRSPYPLDLCYTVSCGFAGSRQLLLDAAGSVELIFAAGRLMSDGTPRQHFADGHAALPLLAISRDAGVATTNTACGAEDGTVESVGDAAAGGAVDALVQSNEEDSSLKAVGLRVVFELQWVRIEYAALAKANARRCAAACMPSKQLYKPQACPLLRSFPLLAGSRLAGHCWLGRAGTRRHCHSTQLQRHLAAYVVPLAPLVAGRACMEQPVRLQNACQQADCLEHCRQHDPSSYPCL